MTFYTQWKCFKSLKKDKCVDWRKGSTCISEENCTDFCNKSCRTCCLCEADAVVAWVWFNQWREFAGCFPVKLTAVYDNTTDGCSVSADELCCWMNNDICAIFDGRIRFGVPNVLSITSGILFSCAIFAISSISTTLEFGLPSVSMNTAFVLSWMAFLISSKLLASTNVVVMPYAGNVCSNRLYVPP